MWSNPNKPRRCASPNTPRTFTKTPLSVPTRAVSTDRRRPVTPQSHPSTPVHDTLVNMDLAARKGAGAGAGTGGGKLPETLWPSRTRSLSVAFMSNTFSLSTSKREKPPPQALTDCTSNVSQKRVSTPERKRSPLKGKNAVVQLENRRPGKTSSKGLTLTLALTKDVEFPDKPMKTFLAPNVNVNGSARLPSPSKQPGMGLKPRPISPAPSKRASFEPRPISPAPSKRASFELRTISPAPSKRASPSRLRPSSPLRQACNSNRVSVLTFVADIKKGKKVNDQIEDAHYLRLLYNRQLQWRYVNASADAVFKSRKFIAQTCLYNVCRSTSELYNSVAAKRIELDQLRSKLKLYSCLNQQMAYLNEWAKTEKDHNLALFGATEDLKASTLRLPVTGGATVDSQTMKSSLRSAFEVMQTMASTMQSTLSRLEESNCLASELANVTAHERALLNECEVLLNSTASLQAKEYSLRTQLVQMKQELTTTH